MNAHNKNLCKNRGLNSLLPVHENTGRVIDLFPLNGSWWFTADVIHHTGNPVDFIDDAVGNTTQEVIRQMRPVRSHKVDGFDGTQGDHPIVLTTIAHDAYGTDRQEDGERPG